MLRRRGAGVEGALEPGQVEETNNVKDSHHTFDFPVLQLTINKKVRGTFSINYGYTNKTAGLPALFYEGEVKEGRAILTGIYEKADLVRRDI